MCVCVCARAGLGGVGARGGGAHRGLREVVINHQIYPLRRERETEGEETERDGAREKKRGREACVRTFILSYSLT